MMCKLQINKVENNCQILVNGKPFDGFFSVCTQDGENIQYLGGNTGLTTLEYKKKYSIPAESNLSIVKDGKEIFSCETGFQTKFDPGTSASLEDALFSPFCEYCGKMCNQICKI